jgi:hypothetical protein
MNLKVVGWGDMDWIVQAVIRDRLQLLVNRVTSLQVV